MDLRPPVVHVSDRGDVLTMKVVDSLCPKGKLPVVGGHKL